MSIGFATNDVLTHKTYILATDADDYIYIYIYIYNTLIKGRKKWRPRRHSPIQPRAQGLRKRGKRGGIGGWREGRGRKELTASWKKISRAWAIGSTEATRKVGRDGSDEAPG